MHDVGVERDVEAVLRGVALDGIVLSADLGAVSMAAVRHQVDEGRLEDVGRGVWKLRDHPWDRRCELRAALSLAGTEACLGLRTAARLHSWYRYRRSEAVEVVVRRGRDQRTSIGRIFQTRVLPPAHVTVVDGLPVTTAARTFFDLCGDPDPGLRRRGGHPVHARNMERVYNDIVARRGVAFAHEAAVHLVMARRGRRGTVLVRQLLRKFGPRYEPTHSEAESLFVELLEAYDIPAPKRQVPISDLHGFIGKVDFYWPAARHVIEIDSTWHDGPLDVAHDLERDERLRAAGHTVCRYRYGRMVVDPAGIARELGVAIAAHATSTTPS